MEATTFCIVIPAYNEEKAVQAILRRCVEARKGLKSAGIGIDEVEIVLVNDGSRDATEELALAVPGARVVSHPVNRGYGAAIKTGFKESRAAWLGFLDADGTCDPEFFKELLAFARKDGLDVALGSRMHAKSKMPAVRVLGNRLFRSLVNAIGGSGVTDIASGMRVVRRAALERLYPLPDGMHFTPAMSVRAILDPSLKIGELPMPYEERIGRSKLNAFKDGLRFLRVILETSVTYRPLKFFLVMAAALALSACACLFLRLGAAEAPAWFYLKEGRVLDWMIFRLILVAALLAVSVFLLALGAVAQSLVGIINHEKDRMGGRLVAAFMERFWLYGLASLAAAVLVNRRPLFAYWRTGHIPLDFWVFPVAGALFAIGGFELLAFSLVARIARLLWERERYRQGGSGL